MRIWPTSQLWLWKSGVAGASLLICAACGRDTRRDALAEEALPPSAWAVFGTDGNPRIYVADQDSSYTRLCFDAPDLGYAPGTPVTVIHPAFPQFATSGRLDHRSKAPCFPPPRASPDSMQYVVDAPADTIWHRGVPIVILGKVPEPRMRGDTVLVEIEPGKEPWRFRSCASTEGVHATAWSGPPLSAPRRWHAYYSATTSSLIAPPPTTRPTVRPRRAEQ